MNTDARACIATYPKQKEGPITIDQQSRARPSIDACNSNQMLRGLMNFPASAKK
jgi:hypothetical protein